MAVSTAYVVAPMFPTPEVVVLFFARMACQAGLRNCLGRFVLEGNDLGWIAFFAVGFARTMARFAASDLSFPTADG